MDSDLLDFLVSVSILDEFIEESANYVLKINNFAEYIKDCETNGLFLQKTLGTTITYRFHTLFRSTLQKIQEERCPAGTISQTHLLAAEYFRSKQSFGKAIEHYLAVGRTDFAAEMISNACRELTSLEAMSKLRLLFECLPQDVLEGNSGLMYMKSFLYQNGEEEANRLLQKSPSMNMRDSMKCN